MDGVLVIDKRAGLTSHDVVARARRGFGTRRIGHIGTLDPLATGVLPLVVGRATRLASLLAAGKKVYEGVIRLGVVTDTYDVTGTVVPDRHDGADHKERPVDLTTVETTSLAFRGRFLQHPPAFSAKKIRGVRAYRLARRRQPVETKAVEVTVHALEFVSLTNDRLHCRVTCDPGFYMRAFAHDLGAALGCGGCLEALRREQSGAFGLDQAVSLDALENEPDWSATRLLPLPRLLPELPHLVLTDAGTRRAAHGNSVSPTNIACGDPSWRQAAAGRENRDNVKLYDRRGTLIAIAQTEASGALHPTIVLV